MKNLFFVLFLIAGFSLNTKAQNLQYYFYNISTTATWDFGMDDASPMPAQYELGMAPSTNLTNTYGSTFALPLEWKAQDSNGCYVYDVIVSAPFSGSALTSCGTTVYYKIEQSAPFLYQMKMQFP